MVLSLDFVALHVTHLVTSASDLGCSVCVGGGGGGSGAYVGVCFVCEKKKEKKRRQKCACCFYTAVNCTPVLYPLSV